MAADRADLGNLNLPQAGVAVLPDAEDAAYITAYRGRQWPVEQAWFARLRG